MYRYYLILFIEARVLVFLLLELCLHPWKITWPTRENMTENTCLRFTRNLFSAFREPVRTWFTLLWKFIFLSVADSEPYVLVDLKTCICQLLVSENKQQINSTMTRFVNYIDRILQFWSHHWDQKCQLDWQKSTILVTPLRPVLSIMLTVIHNSVHTTKTSIVNYADRNLQFWSHN